MNLEHKKRWIAAVVGVSLLLAVYFFLGHFGLVALTVAVSVVSYSEFLTMSGAASRFRLTSLAIATALSIWLGLNLPGALPAFYLGALLLLLQGLWQAHGTPELMGTGFQQTQARIFGLVYLVLFPSFVPKLHSLPHGPWLLLFLLLIIWTGDTAAYYGGKTLGRHKLSPVSPGKTREGALVALVACVLLALIFRQFALSHLPAWKLALIALLTSVVAQAGDLLESLMKRTFQVKDSGRLIPGHGGVFDRFDSLILAAPFFYLLLRLAA